ncbi:hypothetical protein [Nocardiopsis rhodophaea]|uniref:hypothetical protein n=1 Tax=Nocardiopsis rhodophaea TaxID=280238 RepID=UPI0031D12D32
MTTTDTSQRTPLDTAATLTTELLAPWVAIPAQGVLIALHSAPHLHQALLWGGIATLTGAAIPMAFILAGARLGHWANRHVPDRAHRRWPLLVCLASSTAGMLTLWAVQAPREMVVLVGCWAGALAVVNMVTAWAKWKISVHALTGFIAAAGLTVVYGASAAVAWPLAVAVAWSKVRIRHHTVGQVVVGGGVGVLSMAVFALLK